MNLPVATGANNSFLLSFSFSFFLWQQNEERENPWCVVYLPVCVKQRRIRQRDEITQILSAPAKFLN